MENKTDMMNVNNFERYNLKDENVSLQNDDIMSLISERLQEDKIKNFMDYSFYNNTCTSYNDKDIKNIVSNYDMSNDISNNLSNIISNMISNNLSNIISNNISNYNISDSINSNHIISNKNNLKYNNSINNNDSTIDNGTNSSNHINYSNNNMKDNTSCIYDNYDRRLHNSSSSYRDMCHERNDKDTNIKSDIITTCLDNDYSNMNYSSDNSYVDKEIKRMFDEDNLQDGSIEYNNNYKQFDKSINKEHNSEKTDTRNEINNTKNNDTKININRYNEECYPREHLENLKRN
ncbi:hypothetical protein PFLG_02887 [Plasmodium falciparum RAJ116]|uniref:Uncharacterized protein n=1 Tax=Plasmodium falciparum RAJ116 TaxID=580058 RepID=A0A0L0CZD3_PLAFA|nr:hypothetical protein PFLG_02887 [Plasmodium falciparum RAJ116]